MFGFKRKNKKNKKDEAHSQAIENGSVDSTQKAEAANNAQKRNHFRLDCDIPAVTKAMSKNERNQIILGDPYETLISNLSSGGAKLLTNSELKNNERLLITFKLDDDLITLTGEIKFISESLHPDYLHQYGLKFIGTSTKDQDIICRYLFKEQIQSIL